MSSDQNYSLLDRMLHRLAFSRPAVQLTAADLETTLYGSRFQGIHVQRPIFITSLPRAGTTWLLEFLAGLPGLATHRYRDMPFVLAPLLWDALSKRFQKPVDLRERAHGDGMKVGYDNPEAFEEILWRTFFPKKFKGDRIMLWSENEDADEFRQFFVSHMQKIIAVRSNSGGEERRYLSKNNANIVRIGLLKRLFPDCLILIPFRSPLDQATSLLRQHARFLSRHGEDSFSKRYMDDIGHLEFGELHRPIWFEGVDEMVRKYRTDSPDYWVAYWVHAFRHVVEYKDEVVLVSYEKLCEAGLAGLRAIAGRLGIQHDALRDASAPEFRALRSYNENVDVKDKELLEHAQALHSQLLTLSMVFSAPFSNSPQRITTIEG